MLDTPHYDFIRSTLEHIYSNTKEHKYKPRVLETKVVVELIRELIFRDHLIDIEPEIIKLIFTTFMEVAQTAFIMNIFDAVTIPYIGKLRLHFRITDTDPLDYYLRHSIKIRPCYTKRFLQALIKLAQRGASNETLQNRPQKKRKKRRIYRI